MSKRRDQSQALRLGMQFAFAALNVWIGFRFVAWVREVETFGSPMTIERPAGIGGWLPIAGLMNLKLWLSTWTMPDVHPSALVLLLAFIAISLLLRKAFCSWLCPIGTLSEVLWKLGRRIGRENLALPRWADLPLRGLKYVIFAFFAITIARMPGDAIESFMRAPYAAVADIRMLDFFRFISTTALIVIAVLIALSVIIQNFWCRYLCPYGALLGLVSMFSPTAITRDPDACIDCLKCTKACPARLPVAELPRVRSAECTMCLACVAVCPKRGALEAKLVRRKRLPAWAIAAAIAVIFLGAVVVARVTGHWQNETGADAIRYFLALTRR